MADYFHDLVIIGGGPAGLTAGLYASRSRLDAILLEKLSLGGQVLMTEWIENYPGFPEGVGGFEIIDRMKSQAEKFGLIIQNEEILGLKTEGHQRTLIINSGTITCRSLIIATGAQAKKLGVEAESRLIGKGVSYCATCDAAFFSDCVVTVVGGGDTAIEEALYLTKFASKVYIIHRREQLRATKILQERALTNKKIEIIWNTVINQIAGTDLVQGVQLMNVKTGEVRDLNTEALFVFVGNTPVTGFINGGVELDEGGFIKVNEKMETSLLGVFAAGDVTSHSVRQISAAVGQGAIAAINAEKYLENQGR
jgi:thioredoxin reductase (NADPH)